MLLVKNNAASTLLGAITGASTELGLPSGHGARFPLPGAGEFFFLTLQEGATFEIVRCTARVGDELTVVRAQDGTTAQSFGVGSSVTMRIVAGVFTEMLSDIAEVQEDADAAAAAAAAAQDTADAAAASAAAAVATRLPTSGGTLTGTLAVSYANPLVQVRKQTIGETALVAGFNGLNLRWGVALGDSATETGVSNQGSNFAVYRYNDAGGYIDAPFYINRENGNASFSASVRAGGTLGTPLQVLCGESTNGRVNMVPGDVTNPGYTEFRTADNIRRGYIGWKISGNNIGIVAENGWGLAFSGTVHLLSSVYADAGSIAIRHATIPILRFARLSDDAFFGQIYANGTTELAFQLGSSIFRLTSDNMLQSPRRLSNASDQLAQIETDTGAGGAGDNNIAAYGFHIPGTYRTKLKVRGDGLVGFGGNSASPWRVTFNMNNGDLVAAGNVAAYSDARLKDDLRRIESPFAILDALTGFTFTWLSSATGVVGRPGERDTGIIAQDAEIVQHMVPGLVSESETATLDDGSKAKLVAYTKLVPVLIEAVKALHARVQDLEAKAQGF